MDGGAAEVIKSLGWTQGSILTGEFESPAGQLIQGQFIVASHPCDVVQGDLEKEPFCELLPIEQVAMNGNLRHGKNPRQLQMENNGDLITVGLVGRVAVPRERLAEFSPEGALDPINTELLRTWLAARYSRPFFADEFNMRLRPIGRSLEKLLARRGMDVSGIYISVSREELVALDPYQIVLVMVMQHEDFSDGAKVAEADEVLAELVTLLQSCDGIEVLDSQLLSERQLSLESLRQFSRWDYDYISYRAGAGESLAPPV